MAIKFEKIKSGMTLWDVRRNTGFGSNKWNVWPVSVESVDMEKRTVKARWNGNKLEEMHENRITQFRANRPE